MCSHGKKALNVYDIESASYHQASRFEAWRKAIKDEMKALVKNETLTLTELLKNIKSIT